MSAPASGELLAVLPRLLLVADHTDVIRRVRLVAERLGFEVRIVPDADWFRAYLSTGVPTVVLLDLAVSDAVAVEVIRHLQVRPGSARLMLMSRLDPSVLKVAEMLVSASGPRVDAVVRKPIDAVDIERQLSAARREILVDGFDLNQAIVKDEITVHYQPKIDLESPAAWRVVSFESLARWEHPSVGIIQPDFFIPLAERSGLIWPLSLRVIDVALTNFRDILKSRPGLTVSINLSPLLLKHEYLARDLRGIADRHGVDPSQVIFEISESGASDDQVAAIDGLGALRARGFRLSMDDFGSGRASLSQIRRLPLGEVKVDSTRIGDVAGSEEARVILELLIDLSRRLDISVCAKHIESRSRLELLRAMGCDRVQGFYFGRPQAFEAIRPLFRGATAAPVELGGSTASP
ncbi:MAG TPA: EAL domain-containing response regulator [Gammaproteobacteria bacterium]